MLTDKSKSIDMFSFPMSLMSSSIDAKDISRNKKSPNNEIFIQDNNFMKST